MTSQVYPIGIPLLYAFILWVNRESLNPRVQAVAGPEPDGETALPKGSSLPVKPQEEEEDLQERIEKRRQNPDLVPSMFLWKDFGERRRHHF